jgi:putative transposase
VKYKFIDVERSLYSIRLLCRVLEISKSGYYKWVGNKRFSKKDEYRALVDKIEKIHSDSRKTYGSPRVFQKLKKAGEKISKNTVAKLMNENNIMAKTKKKFKLTTDSKHNLNVSPNLLARNFNPENINEAWCGDITYIHTNEGWLFLATVIDLYSRKIIGWSMNKRMKKSLVVDAMNMALGQRKTATGVIFHSDRGSQYCSNEFRKVLKRNSIMQSMSRKGNCWDNAVAESFFSTLKKDLVFHEEFETREEAKRKIFEYIEVFYNRERIHSVLDFKSPIEYELNVA